jgi:PII-like signaling protein
MGRGDNDMKRFLGKKKILRIYIDNQDKFEGHPLWEEILKKTKELDIAGATVFKGVAGIGAHSELRSFNVFTISQELPLVIEIIDSEEKIIDFIDKIDFMIYEGITTMSDTQVIKYKHK